MSKPIDLMGMLPADWKDKVTAREQAAYDKATKNAKGLATAATSYTKVSSTLFGSTSDAGSSFLTALPQLIKDSRLHLGFLQSNLAPVVTTDDDGEPSDYCTVALEPGMNAKDVPPEIDVSVNHLATCARLNVTRTYDVVGSAKYAPFVQGATMNTYNGIDTLRIIYNTSVITLNGIGGQNISQVATSLNTDATFVNSGLKAAIIPVQDDPINYPGQKLYHLLINSSTAGAGNDPALGGRGSGTIIAQFKTNANTDVPAPGGGGNLFSLSNAPTPLAPAPSYRYEQGILGQDATVSIEGHEYINTQGLNTFEYGGLTITAKQANSEYRDLAGNIQSCYQTISMKPNTAQVQSEFTELIDQLNRAFTIIAKQQETETGDDNLPHPVEGASLVNDWPTELLYRTLSAVARSISGAGVGVEFSKVDEDSEGPARYKLVINDADLFDRSMHENPEKLRNVLFNNATATPAVGVASTLDFTSLTNGLSTNIAGKNLQIRVNNPANQVDVDFGDGAGFVNNVGTLNGTRVTFTDTRLGDLELRYTDKVAGAAQTFNITITTGSLDKLGDQLESYKKYIEYKMSQTGSDIIKASEDTQRKQDALAKAQAELNRLNAKITALSLSAQLDLMMLETLTDSYLG